MIALLGAVLLTCAIVAHLGLVVMFVFVALATAPGPWPVRWLWVTLWTAFASTGLLGALGVIR